jgi:hypothetical protein
LAYGRPSFAFSIGELTMPQVVGVTSDKQTAVSEGQGGGTGLIVVGGGFGDTSPTVFSYDVDGTLEATYDEGEGEVAFGASQDPDFMSSEITWNPSNSGTISCVGTGVGSTSQTNAINGIGSRSVDTSGDLLIGMTQSGSVYTAYQTFIEFSTTGLPPAVGGTKDFVNGSSNAVTPGRLQIGGWSVSGTANFSFFALDYGTPSTGPWVPLDAGNFNDDRTVDDAPFMQEAAITVTDPVAGTRTQPVLQSMITGRRPTRLVFVGRRNPSLGFGLATISRSAGLKLKYMIHRRGLRSAEQLSDGIIVRAYY